MPRNPYFRRACHAWYVFHNGKQVRLGRTKREADQVWQRLLKSNAAPPQDVRVAELADRFLNWCEENRAPATVTFYRQFLRTFLEQHGDKQATTLRPFHVTEWLRRYRYEGTTGNCAVRTVSRLFNWCARQGIFGPNPIAGVERPRATPRETYVTREQWTATLAHVDASDPFRDLLELLWETGARPQEVRAIEARHFDPVARTVTFPRNESKGKRCQRVIVLNQAAYALASRLAQQTAKGPVLRNLDGNPWTILAINCRFARLKRKVGFNIFAYAIRHTWATNALLAGVEPLTVATLMGHASIQMVWSTYQKLQLQGDHMRAAAEQATRPRTQTPPSTPQAIPPTRETAQLSEVNMIAERAATRPDYDAKAEEAILELSETPDNIWKLLNLIPQLIDGTANPLDIMDRDRLRLLGSFAFVGITMRADRVKREEAQLLRQTAKRG